MESVSNGVYVIPDTNILIGKRKWREFIEKLVRYRDGVVVGLPQIPVEESLEKGRSLYVFACKHDDHINEFLQHLKSTESELRAHGLNIEEIPIPCLLNLSRLTMCYLVGEDDEKLLSQAIQSYLGKKYKPAIAYIAYHCLEVNREIDIETFWWVLDRCCIFLNSNDEECWKHCRALYGMLGDVLLLSSAHYIYRTRNAGVIMVSDDKSLCSVAEELSSDGYFSEKLVKCTPLKDIERVLMLVGNSFVGM